MRGAERQLLVRNLHHLPEAPRRPSCPQLPRIRFLLLLCKEQQRINALIAKMSNERLGKMDLQRTGQVRGGGLGAAVGR